MGDGEHKSRCGCGKQRTHYTRPLLRSKISSRTKAAGPSAIGKQPPNTQAAAKLAVVKVSVSAWTISQPWEPAHHWNLGTEMVRQKARGPAQPDRH
jgi:hypothetical protein